MTIIHAMQGALEMLEAHGITGGAVHDDLAEAIARLLRLRTDLIEDEAREGTLNPRKLTRHDLREEVLERIDDLLTDPAEREAV